MILLIIFRPFHSSSTSLPLCFSIFQSSSRLNIIFLYPAAASRPWHRKIYREWIWTKYQLLLSPLHPVQADVGKKLEKEREGETKREVWMADGKARKRAGEEKKNLLFSSTEHEMVEDVRSIKFVLFALSRPPPPPLPPQIHPSSPPHNISQFSSYVLSFLFVT